MQLRNGEPNLWLSPKIKGNRWEKDVLVSLEFPSRIWVFKLAEIGIKLSLTYYPVDEPKVTNNKRNPSLCTTFSPPLMMQWIIQMLSGNSLRSLIQFFPWMIDYGRSCSPKNRRELTPLVKSLEDAVLSSYHLRLGE